VIALRTACFIVLGSICASAAAQDYPSKPVRIIVGFPPGGATDLVARILQPRLAQELKREIIVDNRPGANGVVGAELAAKAPPDGYSLHLATLAALVISPAITKVPYDPARDFTPIGRLVELQNIFIAHPSLPVSSIQELIAAAKARPGAFNYATSGAGSTGHLSGELLKNMAGIDWVHIPYRGGGPAMTDFLAGQVQVFVAVISTAVPYVKQGKARALAVTGTRRATALPDVPTVAESGLPGYESTNWFCLIGPAQLPQAIVDRWHKVLASVLADSEVRLALLERGVEASPSTPGELAAHLRAESAKWSPIARAAGLRPE
jgi:tripartite-type tricarboxylate transporter receptor subunit TctC